MKHSRDKNGTDGAMGVSDRQTNAICERDLVMAIATPYTLAGGGINVSFRGRRYAIPSSI